eukprot:3754679-Pyramimonas_sp.AAC.1
MVVAAHYQVSFILLLQHTQPLSISVSAQQHWLTCLNHPLIDYRFVAQEDVLWLQKLTPYKHVVYTHRDGMTVQKLSEKSNLKGTHRVRAGCIFSPLDKMTVNAKHDVSSVIVAFSTPLKTILSPAFSGFGLPGCTISGCPLPGLLIFTKKGPREDLPSTPLSSY